MESVSIIAEFANKNWSAFSQNLPGVFVTASSLSALQSQFVSAARFHVDGLAEDGEPIPAVDLSTYVIFPIVYSDSLGSLRKSLGISQEQIAQELNTSQSRVSELERNPNSVAFGTVRGYLAVLEKLANLPSFAIIERENGSPYPQIA